MFNTCVHRCSLSLDLSLSTRNISNRYRTSCREYDGYIFYDVFGSKQTSDMMAVSLGLADAESRYNRTEIFNCETEDCEDDWFFRSIKR